MVSNVVYATVEELKAQPNVTGNGDDIFFSSMLIAASRVVDGFCNRMDDGFVAEEEASPRVFSGKGQPWLMIDDHASSPSSVLMKPDTSSLTYSMEITNFNSFRGSYEFPNFNKLPYNGIMLSANSQSFRFTSGYLYRAGGVFNWDYSPPPANEIEQMTVIPTVQVTARWGYSLTIPALIKQATITQASRWVKRGQSFWADTAGTSDMPTLMYTKPLDPDLKMMLENARMVKPIYAQ